MQWRCLSKEIAQWKGLNPRPSDISPDTRTTTRTTPAQWMNYLKTIFFFVLNQSEQRIFSCILEDSYLLSQVFPVHPLGQWHVKFPSASLVQFPPFVQGLESHDFIPGKGREISVFKLQTPLPIIYGPYSRMRAIYCQCISFGSHD